MGAFKQFNSQDIIISPLQLTKGFEFKGGGILATASLNISSSAQYTASNYYSIERYLGNKFNTTGSTGYNFKLTSSEVYNSVKQLYYSNYVSSSNGNVQPINTASYAVDGTIQGRIGSNAYENFEQTDLVAYKYFPTSSYNALRPSQNGSVYGSGSNYGEAIYSEAVIEPTISVMSIPQQLFGDQIMPGSLKINCPSGSYFDDGEGRLKRINNTDSSSIVVGNVVYTHGIIIFTGGSRNEATGHFADYNQAEFGDSRYGGRLVGANDVDDFTFSTDITASFSSSFTIYEKQYKATISEDDFNYSQNPTIISGSSNSGIYYNFATSSFFSPYVTTVGMYNEQNELLAVGKLAHPLPTSRTTDTTILVNIDRQ